MAAATCYYHPDQVSSTTCAQCGMPLCSGCVETVANQPVCRGCVGAIRARVAAEMNAAPQPPGATQPNPFMPQAQAVQPVPQTNVMGLLLGIVYGTVAGAVGAFLLAKIELMTGIELGLLNSLVGFGCGYGVLLGCKRGGLVPAVLGGVLALFAMILSEYFWFSATTLSQQETFAVHLGQLRIEWLFIAIGVYGGAKTPLRAGRR